MNLLKVVNRSRININIEHSQLAQSSLSSIVQHKPTLLGKIFCSLARGPKAFVFRKGGSGNWFVANLPCRLFELGSKQPSLFRVCGSRAFQDLWTWATSPESSPEKCEQPACSESARGAPKAARELPAHHPLVSHPPGTDPSLDGARWIGDVNYCHLCQTRDVSFITYCNGIAVCFYYHQLTKAR